VGLADLRVQSYAATAKWCALVVVALAFWPWRWHHAHAEERWRAVADVVRHHRDAHARTLVEMAGQEAAKWTDELPVCRRFLCQPTYGRKKTPESSYQYHAIASDLALLTCPWCTGSLPSGNCRRYAC
jgi:hypothetical protein